MSTNPSATWLRGVLEICLLGLLEEGASYGYELAASLERNGLGRIPGGSLYPALLRLERVGHLQAVWRAGDGGPGRKYYALTPEGQQALDRGRADWLAFAGNVEAVLARSTAL